MSARLGRYAPIQLMDYVIERGLVTFGMGLLFGWMMKIALEQSAGGNWASGDDSLRIIRLFFVSYLGLFTWFATLTAVNGIISNDRTKGTFRFLFAKPVNVLRYYAQAWLINGLGLLLVLAALMGIFAIAVRPFFPSGILLYVAMTYVILGGVGFFLSAVTKRDGIWLVVFWLVAIIVRGQFHDRTGFKASLVRFVTPPTNEMSLFIDAVMNNRPADMGTFAAAVAYGAVFVALGLIVLRYRPMSS